MLLSLSVLFLIIVEVLAYIKLGLDPVIFFFLASLISGMFYCFTVPFHAINSTSSSNAGGMKDSAYKEYAGEHASLSSLHISIFKNPTAPYFAVNLIIFIVQVFIFNKG